MEASRGGRRTPTTVLSALAVGSRAEGREGENGERKTRARGLPPLEAETRGGGAENVGAGESGFGGFQTGERLGTERLEEGGGPNGWAPPVSCQGEKGGREGSRLGQAQEGGVGRAGLLGHKAEKKEGEERKTFSFYFPNKISKLFPK